MASRWNPFEDEDEEMPSRRQTARDPFRHLQQQMNRLFESFFQRAGMSQRSSMPREGGEQGGMQRTRPGERGGMMSRRSEHHGGMMPMGREQRFRPRIDVSEDADSLTVTAELPGMTKDDIDLYCDEDSVTIQGEKSWEETEEDEGYIRTERSYGSFRRRIPFPTGIDSDNADASFQDGVLKVQFPKTGESKGKRLDIE